MSSCSAPNFSLRFRENWKKFWSFCASILCLESKPENPREISEITRSPKKPPPLVARRTGEKVERSTVPSEQLLPGISNDITVTNIIPRLSILPPVLSSPTLSLVSGGWRRAIHSEEVYDVSTHFHSPQTCVALECNLGDNPQFQHNRIALYSVTDRNIYPLPLLPCFDGLPFPSKCVSLDRKLYLIGGQGDLFIGDGDDGSLERNRPYMAEMYVLDLAQTPLEWRQCATMGHERKDFGCGVKDGRIYIFGGAIAGYYHPINGAEVYDPESDCWSPISPMKTDRSGHQVATIGEELLVYGGCSDDGEHEVHQLEFYRPGRDEWRVVKPFGRDGLHRMFLHQGKFYAMTMTGIFVHDGNIEANSWREIRTFSLSGKRGRSLWASDGDDFNDLCPILVVNGELLTAFYGHFGDVTGEPEVCFVQSKGFGRENKDLEWERAECNRSISFVLGSPLLCLITL